MHTKLTHNLLKLKIKKNKAVKKVSKSQIATNNVIHKLSEYSCKVNEDPENQNEFAYLSGKCQTLNCKEIDGILRNTLNDVNCQNIFGCDFCDKLQISVLEK